MNVSAAGIAPLYGERRSSRLISVTFGRTATGLTALFAELLERRVNLVSLRDSIDLNTAAGRLMANMLASVAQYETEDRAERVRAGQAIARAAGRTWGGSRPGRMLHVTPDQARTIRQMKYEGERVSAIARARRGCRGLSAHRD